MDTLFPVSFFHESTTLFLPFSKSPPVSFILSQREGLLESDYSLPYSFRTMVSLMSQICRLCVRYVPMSALRQSAFRKLCRWNQGRNVMVGTQHGFRMRLEIGDNVENLIFAYGTFERGTSIALRHLAPDRDALVDVGCNIGYFSCLFRAVNPRGTLFCIDPNEAMIRRTVENLQLNGTEGFQTFTLAAGGEASRAMLHIPAERHSLASLAYAPAKGGRLRTTEVDVAPLRALLADSSFQSGLLKVDAEGFEGEVFRGIDAALARRFANIIFEYSPSNLTRAGVDPAALFQLDWLRNFAVAWIEEDGRALPALPEELPAIAGPRGGVNLLLTRIAG